MSLKHSYTLISPFYDLVLAAASRGQRADSLAALPQAPARVLLSGVGTGLDLPLLPLQHRYTGIDLTPAMYCGTAVTANSYFLLSAMISRCRNDQNPHCTPNGGYWQACR